MKYEWFFRRDDFTDYGRAIKYAIYGISDNYEEVCVTIKDGQLVINNIKEMDDLIPLFTVNRDKFVDLDLILQALADGLAEMGYHQKTTEAIK